MVLSVQRVAEKKVRRFVSVSSARRSRLPIGVNVGSLRRVWYLGVFEVSGFRDLPLSHEATEAVLVLIARRKKGDIEGFNASFFLANVGWDNFSSEQRQCPA